jgi:hypothetical protein
VAYLSFGTVRNSGVSRCDSRVLAVNPSEMCRETPPNETVPNDNGQASGELLISNIDEATDDLVGLWQGFLPVDLGFHQPPDPKAAYLRARAARGVHQFMRLYSCNPRRSKAPR